MSSCIRTGRSKREVCPDCRGDGWIETSGDATAVQDIVMVNGQPQWVTRYVPIDNSHLTQPTASQPEDETFKG
jgi:hypothetical protein